MKKKLPLPTLIAYCVGLGITILIVVEFILRAFVPSLQEPIVYEKTYDGIQWYEINPAYLKTYIAWDDQYIPHLTVSQFKKEKDPNSIRIMVFGESFASGFPYRYTSSISGIIRTQLRHLNPDAKIEVINFAAPNIDSDISLKLLNETIQYQPDLVIAAIGTNEFYGPNGVEHEIRSSYPRLQKIFLYLNKFYITKLFKSFNRVLFGFETPHTETIYSAQFASSTMIPLESNDRKNIINRFQQNLKLFVAACKNSNVPIILCTLPSNEMLPPVAVGAFLSKEHSDQYSKSMKDFSLGKNYEALDSFLKLSAIYPLNANVSYSIGRVYAAIGKYNRALLYLKRAKNLDLVIVRPPEEINKIITIIGKNQNIPIARIDLILDSLFSSKYSYFLDHIHPTLDADYIIADNIVSKIVQQKILTPQNSDSLSAIYFLPLKTDSLFIPLTDLARSELLINSYVKAIHQDVRASKSFSFQIADSILGDLGSQSISDQLGWTEACYQGAALLIVRGLTKEAQITYEAVLQEFPTNFFAHYSLAKLHVRTNNENEAKIEFQKSIEYNPQFLSAYMDYSQFLLKSSQYETVMPILINALTLTNGEGLVKEKVQILNRLAAVYWRLGDPKKAKVCLDESLTLDPASEEGIELKKVL